MQIQRELVLWVYCQQVLLWELPYALGPIQEKAQLHLPIQFTKKNTMIGKGCKINFIKFHTTLRWHIKLLLNVTYEKSQKSIGGKHCL